MQHTLAIRQMDARQFPKGILDEHHEMILVDLRCGEMQLMQFLNEVSDIILKRIVLAE